MCVCFVSSSIDNIILGMTENEAKHYLERYNLVNRHPDFMTDSFETYKRLGFTTKDIIENGRLFNFYPREHEQHRWVLEESGFSHFTPKLFIRFVTENMNYFNTTDYCFSLSILR